MINVQYEVTYRRWNVFAIKA